MSFEDYCAQEGIGVFYVAMPHKVNGMTVIAPEGFSIYINKDLNEEQQKKTLEHELTHVCKNHFSKGCSMVAEADVHANMMSFNFGSV